MFFISFLFQFFPDSLLGEDGTNSSEFDVEENEMTKRLIQVILLQNLGKLSIMANDFIRILYCRLQNPYSLKSCLSSDR